MSALPTVPGGFGVIYADPPWRFRTWTETNQKRSASRYYGLMETPDIKALPVAAAGAKDCTLLMWAISPMLPQAFAVIEAWGFRFKTVAFVWAKTTLRSTPTWTPKWHVGLGYWTRANAEYCLLATRGKPVRRSKAVRQLIIAPRREHSRKPDEAYERIEALCAGPYLEMFARQHRPGWAAWGDGVPDLKVAA